MKLTRVGVDLAKTVFQVHGVDRTERAVWCKRLKRNRWIEEIEENVKPGAEIGMEACGGAHQHSSGSKERILGISKCGDSYVRTLLIHGARSAGTGKNDRLSRWALALAERSHPNVAATALANKMARVAWSMLRHGITYEPKGLAA